MAPGCKPGGLTPYVGSNPTPCKPLPIFDCQLPIERPSSLHKLEIGNRQSAMIWAGVAQLVEHQPSKLRVASSNLVARSRFETLWDSGPRSSGVERLLGKEEVMSSNLIAGSSVSLGERIARYGPYIKK